MCVYCSMVTCIIYLLFFRADVAVDCVNSNVVVYVCNSSGFSACAVHCTCAIGVYYALCCGGSSSAVNYLGSTDLATSEVNLLCLAYAAIDGGASFEARECIVFSIGCSTVCDLAGLASC